MVRYQCRDSLRYAIREGMLPDYTESGQFRNPARSRGIFSADDLQMAHYCVAEGALYQDHHAWSKAYHWVKSFTTAAVNTRRSFWMFPGRGSSGFTGAFSHLDRINVVPHILDSMRKSGFKDPKVDKALWTIGAELTDSCAVKALPEPYGKYLHIVEGKPQWNQPVDLLLELTIKIGIEQGPPQKSYLEVEFSTLVPAFCERLIKELNASVDPNYRSDLRAILKSTRDQLASWP